MMSSGMGMSELSMGRGLSEFSGTKAYSGRGRQTDGDQSEVVHAVIQGITYIFNPPDPEALNLETDEQPDDGEPVHASGEDKPNA